MTDFPTARPEGQFVVPWTERLRPTRFEDVVANEGATEPILRHFWRVTYRRRWVILSIIAACLAAALLLSMLTQRQYTAVTTIQVDREAAEVIDIESVEADTAAPSLEFYQTQYALLRSRSLSEAVALDVGLADNHLFLANYDEADVDEMKDLPRSERIALATDLVNESINIAPVPGSSIVDIKVEVPDSSMSATLANAIAEKFIETNLSRRFEATSYAREFLQNRLNAVRVKLEGSERLATEYARRQGLVNIGSSGDNADPSSQQSLLSAELAQLGSQLSLARAAREKAEGDYRANRGGNAAAISLSTGSVNQLRQQRAELTGELRKLESDFGPEYPKVIALRAQIGELNRQIAQEQGVVTASVAQDLRDRYRQALAVESGLQGRVNGLKTALLDQQQRAIQFNILQRDVDTNRALYDALLQRYKEVGVAGGVGTNNVSIVDRALPPESPSTPNIPLNLALGLMLGLVLGAGGAFVLDQLSEDIVLPSEFQEKLGVPLLGSAPATKGDVLEKLFASKSAISESYLSVLAALQLSTSNGTPSTLSITSSQPGEGKTTTALAVAKGLGALGATVLLIDGDMRNPSLHRLLKTPNDKGLSDLLAGRADFQEVVKPTEVSGVGLISSGPHPPNPAELLAGEALKRIMNEASEAFDYVVIDSPPILGLADAPLISSAVEGTVFVMEAGRTGSSQARIALDRLVAVRAHVVGAVLTKLDSRNAGYGYGYGYHYEYGQTDDAALADGRASWIPARIRT